MNVTLHIENPYESKSVELVDELSIGRTDAAQLVLDDSGLSRLNTTFFVDEGEVLLTDENSTNGTFLNGTKISGRPKSLADGDEIKIGSSTRIRIEIKDESGREIQVRDDTKAQAFSVEVSGLEASPGTFVPSPIIPQSTISNTKPNKPPVILIAAVVMTLGIILLGGVAFLLVSRNGDKPANRRGTQGPPIISTSLIPVRVIDPLGGEDEDDLDDLIASWETAEEEIKAENVADITTAAGDEAELNVPAGLLAESQRRALEPRGAGGISPAGLDVPVQLSIGFKNQTRKLQQMKSKGYNQPMDFADLAEKRMKRELLEMPMATKSFYLDVGGSAQDRPFSSFSFREGNVDIQPGTPKYQSLSTLAGNYAGQKYDLNNPSDRKQMRMRLLRMFQPRAKPILKELSEAYFQKFQRPLRVTSLTRSMDYQILLNAGNANSFKVTGEGSLPPHTSGCAFDLARKHMPVDEQNFVMKKLAEMESAGKLDALIEYGANACFHVFIYDDGNPPKM